jgi:hypothetical protein
MSIPVNVIFEQMKKCGYTVQDLQSAFPYAIESEIESRLRDTSLGLFRTVERFGYLGTHKCQSAHLNIDEFGNRFVPIESLHTRSLKSITNKNHKLIHFYGGSTVLGSHVSDNETIPYYLLGILRKKLPMEDLSVVNCGGNNHTALHCAFHLLDDCLKGRIPDVAIFINGWNDAMHADGGGDGIIPFLDSCLMQSQSEHGERVTIGELKASLIGQNRTSYRERVIYSDQFGEHISYFRKRYSMAIELFDSIERIFGTYPFIYLEPSPFRACRPDQDLMPKIRELNSAVPMIKNIFGTINEEGIGYVLGKVQKSRVRTLLSNCEQDRQNFPLFIDETHFTPAFNSFLSAQIAIELAPFLIKRKSKKIEVSERSKKKSTNDSDYMYPLW